VTSVNHRILQRLKEKEQEEGKLSLLLQFYRELILVQSRAKEKGSVPRITVNSATLNTTLEQGKPLLGFDMLTINVPSLRELFARVVAIYDKYPQLFGSIPAKLPSPEGRRLLTKKAIRAWFSGEKLPATLTFGDFNPELIPAIIQSTIKPLLASYAEGLSQVVDQERWRRQYCPVCGGRPDFSFLDKERGSRWLLCSRCDTEWVFQRLECPFCDCQEQNNLNYFTDEDELYRLYTCQCCRNYLKAIDLRKTEEDIILPLERLLTVDMDRQAGEMGYKAGWASSV